MWSAWPHKVRATYPSKLAFPGIDELPMPAPPVASAMFVYNIKTDKSVNMRNTNNQQRGKDKMSPKSITFSLYNVMQILGRTYKNMWNN